MILTEHDIELRVSHISGTHISRNNLRKALKNKSNKIVNERINEIKGRIRDLRAWGAKEETLRFWYSEITQYEIKLL